MRTISVILNNIGVHGLFMDQCGQWVNNYPAWAAHGKLVRLTRDLSPLARGELICAFLEISY